MAASAIHATAGWAPKASAHFLRDVLEGGVGIPPSPVIGYVNFFTVYTRHLNLSSPLVWRSTQHGLLTALWRFHPQQPCLTADLGVQCPAHPTEHDTFVALCFQSDITIYLPRAEHLAEHEPHVMALSSPPSEILDTHAWMIAGHWSVEATHRAGWPRATAVPSPPVGTLFPVSTCKAVRAIVLTLTWLPLNYGILHDA